jgi:hypothetical protein
MNKRRVFAASAALLFAASGMAAVASAQTTVKCSGINSCKGTSSCKTALSSCKGKNSCKGQGWTELSSAGDCTAKGGKVM